MPTPTYVALAKTVLTGSQASVTFSAIPSTYTDLVILISARGDNSGTVTQFCVVEFNGDASSLYSRTFLEGDGSSASSGRFSTTYIINNTLTANSATSSTFSNMEFYIPNYAGSTNKVLSDSSVSETNATTAPKINAMAGLYRNTTTISSIKLTALTPALGASNFLSGCRFDLYGIKNS